MKAYLHECGGNLDNETTVIDIPNGDFALVIGKSSYRFRARGNGELEISFINGIEGFIESFNGYPGIRLIDRGADKRNE